MKKFKRSTQLISNFLRTLGILSFAVLASCSQKQGRGSAELLWYGIGPVQKDYQLVFTQVNEYLQERGESYTLKYDSFNWGDYDSKTSLILTSGERADILFTAGWGANYYNHAANGYFQELEPLLETTPALWQSIPENFWDAVRISGKIYGVPAYKDMVYQEYIAFPKEVLQKLQLNIDNVTDIPSLTPFLAEAKEKDPERMPYVGQGFPNIRADYPFGFNVPLVLLFDQPEQGFQVLADVPEFIAQMKTMREWYIKGYIPPDSSIINEGEGYKNPKNKNWFLRNYQGFPGAETSLESSWGVKLATAPLNPPPVLSKSTPTGSMLSIPSSSNHGPDAIDFIALLNTEKDLRNLVGYGIEGLHYKKIGKNIIRKTDRTKDYDVPNFSLGSLLPLYLLEGERPDAREALQEFNETAEASPALEFALDTEKYRRQVAAANATWEEFKRAIAVGSLPVEETLQKMRDKLKEKGWYDAVFQMNTEYQTWRGSRQ